MRNQPEQFSPPKWPLKLLRFFIKKEFLEEIEGDMEEIFHDHAAHYSLKRARWMYSMELLKLLRPILIRNMKPITFTQIPMLRNYFKTSFRSLIKNPLSSFINVFGLSVAIGICLLVYTFLEYDKSIDQFHQHKNEVYLATFFADRDGTEQQYGFAPRPLGEMLKEDFTQVRKVCRIEERNVVIKYTDNVFHESIRYVDPAFLEMFSFPLKWGTPSALADLNSIILSEDMSVKYFGEENPVGRELVVIFNDESKKVFTVAGVAMKFPKAHDLRFDFLINFMNIQVAERNYVLGDWKAFSTALFIQVNEPADIRAIQEGTAKYKSLQNKVQPDWSVSSFAFEPLATLHERAGNIRDAIVHDYNVEGRIGMPIIAIFMILLACFNYINIAIVSAAKRLKEIGVRKVIGANRSKVVVQFLAENLVITFFALVVGFLLCFFIFLPWFVQFTGWDLEIRLLNRNIWIFLLALLFLTGIASGIYPAFYISRFEAIKIFKGSVEFGKKNPLTKIFLGVQMILACITITAAVVFTQNNGYQNSQSWGYRQDGVVYVNVPDQVAYEKMNAAMGQYKNVLMSCGSAHHIGKDNTPIVLRTPSNQQYEATQFAVDARYFEMMGLSLIEGRGLKEYSENDKRALVVNELFVQNMRLDHPIGAVFEIDSARYEVVGVVKDFHARDFFSKVEPAVFRLASEKDYRYLSLRVSAGSAVEAHHALQDQWAKLYPEIPFQGGLQEDVMQNYFQSVDKSQRFNTVIAIIAVLLASLGLYGLVTLNVSGRIREFSIRKTLGASFKNIAWVIVNEYVVLTIVALIIGAPISYLFNKAYLDMLFAYPMPMGISGTAMGLCILVMVLLAVVATQIKKVLHSNPIDGLKTE
jgi:putative ABC transport system permease protein